MNKTVSAATPQPASTDWPASTDAATVLLAVLLVGAALTGGAGVQGFVGLMALGAGPALLLLRLWAAGALALGGRPIGGDQATLTAADPAAALAATAAWGIDFHAIALILTAGHLLGRGALITAELVARARAKEPNLS